MTLHREGKRVYIECEDCPSLVGEDEEYSFTQVVEIAKGLNWWFTRNGTEWEHRCPDCVPKYRLDQQRKLLS